MKMIITIDLETGEARHACKLPSCNLAFDSYGVGRVLREVADLTHEINDGGRSAERISEYGVEYNVRFEHAAGESKNLRMFEVKYQGPTDTQPARVRVHDMRFDERASFTHGHYEGRMSYEQAIVFLQERGINAEFISEDASGNGVMYLLSTDFRTRLHGREWEQNEDNVLPGG